MTSELFTLSEDHRDVRQAIREIAENEIAPFAADVDERERYPVEAQKALNAAGFQRSIFRRSLTGPARTRSPR